MGIRTIWKRDDYWGSENETYQRVDELEEIKAIVEIYQNKKDEG
ncbi:hypothetical protein [Metabacillus herbersteinensis]